jgi:hypothetical protein
MPERLTDPRYWKQTTQDIAGAFAAPPKPQGTPGAFVENVSRPTDQFANQIGEQISPTLGAFGMGQLAGDTAMRASEGDYAGAGLNMPALAMAVAPGFRGAKIRDRRGNAYGVRRSAGPDGQHVFEVLDGDRPIAHVNMNHTNDYVHDFGTYPPEYRQQGIQSALHNHIEEVLGKKLQPGAPYYTVDGMEFWNKRRKNDAPRD